MRYCLLLLALFTCAPGITQAQNRPRIKARHAFTHTAEASKGKNSKARFRRENTRPVIDLNPRNLEKTKTTKAPKPYIYSRGI